MSELFDENENFYSEHSMELSYTDWQKLVTAEYPDARIQYFPGEDKFALIGNGFEQLSAKHEWQSKCWVEAGLRIQARGKKFSGAVGYGELKK